MRRLLLLFGGVGVSVVGSVGVGVGEVERERVLCGIGEGLNEEVAGGRGDAGDKGFGGALEGVAAGEGAEGGDGGERGMEVEAVDVDKLAEVEAVGEDEVGVWVGEEYVGGVQGIGEVQVEPLLIREQVGTCQGGDDAYHLQER